MSTPTPTTTIESLEVKVKRLEQEKAALEQEVRALRLEQSIAVPSATGAEQLYTSNGDQGTNDSRGAAPSPAFTPFEKVAALTNPEIARYGRQLILPGFGIQGTISSTFVQFVWCDHCYPSLKVLGFLSFCGPLTTTLQHSSHCH